MVDLAPNRPALIGASVGRVDGPQKVTGQAAYSADVALPGTLWGAILRSPLPHARIMTIDTARARRLPGVHAVLTGRDQPPILFGRSLSDIPPLAPDVVRFVGDRVAAVAAEDRDSAEEALGLIEVDYEELPAVFDPLEAMRPDAPALHPDFASYHGAPERPDPRPNVCSYERLEKGDVDQALAEAELVLEQTYSTPMQHQVYIEPHTCLVWSQPDGAVHVWASNKAPFLLRDELARVLSLPPEQIVVESTYVGGDFGGKGSAMDVPLAYLLSKASGRPVRMVLGGAEELTAANPRHAAWITIRSGVKRDGRLLARDVRAVFAGGAYAGYKPIPGVNLGGRFWSAGPYRIPHVRFESTVVYTNHVPGGHMRAPGGAQVTFAVELDTDRLAEAVGRDPYEFRLLNCIEDGEVGPLGETWRSVRLHECLRRVHAASGWGDVKLPNVGRGLAVTHCSGGLGGSSAVVQVHADGQVVLLTGVNDQGTGAHTILAQIVAHELRVPVERVSVRVGGTDSAPWDSGSSASRVTYVGGQAALAAAAEARAKLAVLAAEYLGCAEDRVELRGGLFRDRLDAANHLELAELAARAIKPTEPVVGENRFVDMRLVDTPSFAAVVAEVEVDPETGTVAVTRVVAASDVGTVLNAIGATGQLEGGFIQGLGFGLMEELRCGEGRIETASLADYKVPTARDVPPLEHVLITDGPGCGPYGAKPIGELTISLLPAAIANAVYDAVGVRISDLPVTAEKVYAALRRRAAKLDGQSDGDR